MTRIVTTTDKDAAVLRETALSVTPDEFGTPALQKICSDMSDALRNTSDGIGIAAPQIGISKRIFVASEEALLIDEASKKEKKDYEHYVFINPEVVAISKAKINDAEGCLSVPGTYGIVKRAEKIKIRGYDMDGNNIERGASGLFARLFQHEIDHLNGILFIDKATDLHNIAD